MQWENEYFPAILPGKSVSNKSMATVVVYLRGIQSTHSLANQELVGKPCCIQLPVQNDAPQVLK